MTQLETVASETEADPRLAQLNDAITQAANLLPLPGPITAFAFLNTLQALEDMPFDKGMRKGARLYGAQPYLAEQQYREKLAQGRIRVEDLANALEDELGDRANTQVAGLTTRFELRLAMLQYTLRVGPPDEVRWFVLETDALKHMRAETPQAVRKRFIQETRHWAMRDLRRTSGNGRSDKHRNPRSERLVADVIERFGEATIEDWSDATWEAFSLQALWRVCREGVHAVATPAPPVKAPVRHRDLLLEATREDSDELINDVLIRFCAAFTDQGFARWPLPRREEGFFKSFCELYRQPGGPPRPWMLGLAAELSRTEDSGISALASIAESLDVLGVGDYDRETFLASTLLGLRGWAGMLWHMETRPDRVPVPVPPGTLVEYLAVRLLLERLALAYVARLSIHYEGPLDELRDAARGWMPKQPSASTEQRAFLVFQLAQVLGWCPPELYRMSKQQWWGLISEIEAFHGVARRAVFHQAFERRYRIQVLDALSVHTSARRTRVPNPRFQASFCLDAREESFRRHLEEIAPEVETFGLAGFYGVAMYYRGAADANYVALCPVVIKPQHWVVEDVVYTLEDTHRRRAKTRRAVGTASHQVHVGSRSIAGGALLTGVLGVLASIPLVARVLFPHLTAKIRRTAGRLMQAPPITRLRLERQSELPGEEEDEIGYSLEEMANIGERMLRDISLTSGFSRLVFFFGHGSFCLNNPHKSAYDCGACSGTPGGPNGRALAAILNDLRVRDILARRGLVIPSDTRFIGGLHNTAVDSITFLDLDLLPKSHLHDFEAAVATLNQACQRNAHERCRRFESAPLNLTFDAAKRHVEERSEDLAQTRPEFGNASNAVCFVGRRERTRGLYMDRRCFLASYDPTQDDAKHAILARILAAAVPVCEGINMQYNLSYVDNRGWACGTKLPHNVTSLLGVMDGAASDLRPGLPWQSVEIHEPMRLLFVIESSPEAMFSIMNENEVIGRILRNGWAQLAVLDPESSRIQVFRNGRFELYWPQNEELPTAGCSTDWYRGWRDHLGFAVIQKTEVAAEQKQQHGT
jgi:uncharacterized protein